MIKTPSWLKKHEFDGRDFQNLASTEINDLRNRLKKFKCSNPDISIVIPAWNEGDNIFRTLSSLADTLCSWKVEIVVINNNSTDHTQHVLDTLEVTSYFQPLQGIAHARQLGLEKARGKYHLCADSDTFYPPFWVEEMVSPMLENSEVVGVYGRYSFIPPSGEGRLTLYLYEKIAGILIRIRKRNREHINVLGFNMGFVLEIGRMTGGFNVKKVRQFTNLSTDQDFVDESEDGRMALNLKTRGRLALVSKSRARVFTSSRRLLLEGGVLKSFFTRIKLHSWRISEYVMGKAVE